MGWPPLTPKQQAIVDSFSEPATKGDVFAARYAVAVLVSLLHHREILNGYPLAAVLADRAERGAIVGDRAALEQQAALIANLLQTPEDAVRSMLKVVDGGVAKEN